MDPALLLLAKLDFNALQNIYKRELNELSRWWTDLGLPQKLPFFRDRLTENYLWTVGWAMEPDCWAFRELQTKTNCFITMIDDVYDVYGTLHELELFTDIMERWDVNAIDKLPEYMKICFLAVFNTVNDVGYEVMRDKGVDIIPYLKRAWAELCKIYMREARWYHAGHTPTLDEYLDGAWISISGALILSTAYCMGKDLTKEDLDKFSTYPSIVQPSCMLLRLHDDFGTSTDELARGDVQKAVQCCMHERKVPEAVAREHIKQVMEAKWRELNGNRVATSSFEEYFQNVAINVPRAAQFFYGKGDGYAHSDGETQKQVMSLLIEPVQL
ncbi:alpha-terpineol synthase, chloroplastic-like [Zingiber officinale]|uniref:alpha-terpineol synthase, chloroplastic-like n=1 Tax=Zingiber officinale TaxID=94328 RepID=UPI001C4C20CE|nr:alpha-terpineol synthase, chloroplastic-like [Zingiber officinale]